MRGFALAALVVIGVAAWAGPPQADLKIEVSVVDQSKLAVLAVRVELRQGDAAPIVLDTDEAGRAVFQQLRVGKYHISVARRGFGPIGRDLELLPGASLTLEFMLVPTLERTQVEVKTEK